MPNVTTFFYAGAEDPVLLDVLIAAGVKRVTLNYSVMRTTARPRIEHIFTRLSGNGVEVMLDPAVGPMVKEICEENEQSLPRDVLKKLSDFAEEYVAFVDQYKAHIDYALNLDFDPIFIRPNGFNYKDIPTELVDGTTEIVKDSFIQQYDQKLLQIRNEVEDWGVNIIKVWHNHTPLKHVGFVKQFHSVAIRNVSNKTTLRLLMSEAQGFRVHAIGMSKTEWLQTMGFATASNFAWLAGKVYGQTYVWDGRNLVSYNSQQQKECRTRYADHFKSLGFNSDKILANDPIEVSKVNLRAWVDFEKYLHVQAVGGIVPASPKSAPTLEIVEDVWGEEPNTDEEKRLAYKKLLEQEGLAPKSNSNTDEIEFVDIPNSLARLEIVEQDTPSLPLVKAEPLDVPIVKPTRKQQLLKGNDHGVKTGKYHNHTPLQCDTCAIKNRCPKFEEGALCAFREEFSNLSTRNTEAALSELEALAQAQKQRLSFQLMYESLVLGGLADKQTGIEIDRQMKLLEIIGRLRKEMSTVSVHLSPTGIIAQLFGPGVVDPKPLPDDAIDVDAESP